MMSPCRGDMDAVRALMPLQKGKKMMGDTHINGLRISRGTALMMAAAHGHAECIKLLLNREADMQDEDGYTALMSAVINNDLECAGLLAKREGHMKTTCKWNGYPPGSTALSIAERRGHREIADALSK
ncbi:T-complex protein 1/ alpha subunit/ Thioredoxin peroxidase [Giardia duodenalis assemblage B]|uniref:T-complex protein 1/ alpha subunit/ Thioredoxin peroxidase n=1 Tax=Giardia duodenalis assemblage B TaxID=1394984 RepID=A0A132NMJ3_GIAIN|nr:T-complex protein 1/ alpha subunit/ Thioredoxin peroxidase [Giardia intestinalis assemblage B]